MQYWGRIEERTPAVGGLDLSTSNLGSNGSIHAAFRARADPNRALNVTGPKPNGDHRYNDKDPRNSHSSIVSVTRCFAPCLALPRTTESYCQDPRRIY